MELAQTVAEPSTWINFGVLGVIVFALITGWLWTRPSVDRLEQEKQRAIAERDKAEAQRDAMATVLQDRLLPVVGEFVSTTRALLPILQELAGERRDQSQSGQARTSARRRGPPAD